MVQITLTMSGENPLEKTVEAGTTLQAFLNENNIGTEGRTISVNGSAITDFSNYYFNPGSHNVFVSRATKQG